MVNARFIHPQEKQGCAAQGSPNLRVFKCLEGPTHLCKAVVFSIALPMDGIKITTSAMASSCLSSPDLLSKKQEPGNFSLGATAPSHHLACGRKTALTSTSVMNRYDLFENIHTEGTLKSHAFCSLRQKLNFIQIFWCSANTKKQSTHYLLKSHLITARNTTKSEGILIPLGAGCLYTDL